MKRLADRMTAILRPDGDRRVESTHSELSAEIERRRKIKRRTDRLARVLADYRRQDGALWR